MDLIRGALENNFPGLRETGYEVASPPDRRYNCIAWAAGTAGDWWWPRRPYYWPLPTRDDSVAEFVRVFEALGYKTCENPEVEPQCEKVAIYAKGSVVKHMARQLPSGAWTSKCGRGVDINHELTALEGNQYGQVVLIMKRQLT